MCIYHSKALDDIYHEVQVFKEIYLRTMHMHLDAYQLENLRHHISYQFPRDGLDTSEDDALTHPARCGCTPVDIPCQQLVPANVALL